MHIGCYFNQLCIACAYKIVYMVYEILYIHIWHSISLAPPEHILLNYIP